MDQATHNKIAAVDWKQINKADSTKIGYEVSFARHFYKPQPLRTLEEISAAILAVEKEAEGLLVRGAQP